MSAASFTVEELDLPGVLKISPKVFSDERGLSCVNFDIEMFKALGISEQYTFDYYSFSKKGTIRGMHYQKDPYAQNKLVRCAYGSIQDVVFDYRPSSKTFLKHVEVNLDATSQTLLFIPGKYAHGFCVLSDSAAVEYKIESDYKPDFACGIRYNDPNLNVDWPVNDPIVSKQDSEWPLLITN